MFENCKVSLAVSKCSIETFLFNFVKFPSSSHPQTKMKAAKQSDFLDKRSYRILQWIIMARLTYVCFVPFNIKAVLNP